MEITLIQLKTEPEIRQGVTDALQFIRREVELKQGCIKCQIYRDFNDEDTLLYMEQWDSKEALQNHIQSAFYKQLLSIMELAAEFPTVNFYHVNGEESINLVKRLRRKF